MSKLLSDFLSGNNGGGDDLSFLAALFKDGGASAELSSGTSAEVFAASFAAILSAQRSSLNQLIAGLGASRGVAGAQVALDDVTSAEIAAAGFAGNTQRAVENTLLRAVANRSEPIGDTIPVSIAAGSTRERRYSVLPKSIGEAPAPRAPASFEGIPHRDLEPPTESMAIVPNLDFGSSHKKR